METLVSDGIVEDYNIRYIADTSAPGCANGQSTEAFVIDMIYCTWEAANP
jgi:hypothetical protein